MSSTGIPSGWTIVTIEDVADILAGYGFPESLQGRTFGDFPFYKVGDISEAWKRNQTILSSANHYITNDELKDLRATPLPAGTTVFAKIGAAIALNRRAMLGAPSLVDNNVMGLSPFAGLLDPKLLFYFVCTLRLDDLSRSTTVPSIRKSDVAAIRFPLVPIVEQRRIAEELEALLTDLDAAVAALKRVQANLKRYRASVLKSACEGRVVPTEAELARKEGRTYETGEQLLARILKERRAKWEADQLAKMLAAGTPPKNDDWKKKYKEPARPDTSGLAHAPEGWAWATVEQLNPTDRPCAYGVLQPGPDLDEGIPFVRVGDIEDGHIAEDGLKRISPEIARAYPRTKLQGGEVLITLVGAIGRTAVVPESLAGANTARAVGVLPIVPGFARSRWVELWFRNPEKVLEMTGKAHEVARMTLNLEDVRAAVVAIPPFDEQDRIIAEVEGKLSTLKVVVATIETRLIKADRLRQAILKRAFEGKLVPQDPNDEPASVLLESIRAERASKPGIKAGAKRRLAASTAEK